MGIKNGCGRKERIFLGALVRRTREEKGLKQTDLAQQVGVTNKCISNIEVGRGACRASIEKVTEGLGLLDWRERCKTYPLKNCSLPLQKK